MFGAIDSRGKSRGLRIVTIAVSLARRRSSTRTSSGGNGLNSRHAILYLPSVFHTVFAENLFVGRFPTKTRCVRCGSFSSATRRRRVLSGPRRIYNIQNSVD